jgi:hypothetical protein
VKYLEEMHDYLYDNVDHRLGAARLRLFNSHDELGLILIYLGSSMNLSYLCLIFGYTSARCSLVINRQLHFLSRRLNNNAKAQILYILEDLIKEDETRSIEKI